MKYRSFCVLALLLLPGCATSSSKTTRTEPPAPDASMTPSAQSDLYLGIVDGLIRQRRYEAAIGFLAKFQKNRVLSPRYHKLAGDALAGAGRTDEAIASYRQALQSDFAAQAYNGIGRTLSADGNWILAAENFHQAATLDPTNATYLNNFGYAQLKQNFRGPALAPVVSELQRAHELDPDSNLIRANLALALALSGSRTQFLAFLDTISDPGRRKEIAVFSANWTPTWTGDTGIRESTP
ncbi:MAG: tetratricopeptide repeat protein [Pseudomonadota bacterium]